MRGEAGMGNEDLTGKWAVCGMGRLGRIEGRKVLDWGLSWIGTGIDGRPWSSRNPKVLAEADAELLAGLVAGRDANTEAQPA